MLHEENQHICECAKGYFGLNQKLNIKKEIVIEDSANSINLFFDKATDLRKKNKNFRTNIIMSLLRAIEVKQTSSVLNLEKKVFDSFRCLRALSPQASIFVSANVGLEGKAVSN